MSEKLDYKALTNDLNQILKEVISTPYPYAPGFDNSSPQRYKRSAIKNVTGVFQSSEFIYNESNDSIELYMPEYWRYIDEGRRPGTPPPIKPLLEWASLKGLPRSYAFGAQINIGKFGIAPTNFFDTLVDRLEQHLDEVMPDKVGEVLEQIIENIFTKTK